MRERKVSKYEVIQKPVHDDLLSEEVKSDSKLVSLLTNKKVAIPVE